jgi:hypothetical protein
LLGKVKPGERTDKQPSIAIEGKNGVAKDDRHLFRKLAEHKPLVTKLIGSGQVSRAKLLAAIKRSAKLDVQSIDPTRRRSLDAILCDRFCEIVALAVSDR